MHTDTASAGHPTLFEEDVRGGKRRKIHKKNEGGEVDVDVDVDADDIDEVK